MKSRSVYRSLVASNFAILLVAISIALVEFSGFARLSNTQEQDYSQVILRQTRSTFDEKMKSVDKMLLHLLYDSNISSLRLDSPSLPAEDRYRVVQAIKSMEEYVSIYDFVDSICLFNAQSGRVVSNVSYYDTLDLFMSYADCAYWDKASWQALFEGLDSRRYLMHGQIFSILCPTAYGSSTYLILNVDGSFLRELMQNIRSLDKSLIAVCEREGGQVLFAVGGGELSGNLSSGLDFAGLFLEEKGYTVSTLPSRENDWDYYFVLPENAFIEQASDMLTFSLVLFLLLGGVVACIMLARHSFNPIKRIAASLSRKMPMVGENARNELELIGEASARAIDEYTHIRETLTKYLPLLRGKLLDQIFRGVLAVDELTGQDEAASGLRFLYSDYYVALLSFSGQIPEDGRWTALHLMEYIEGLYQEESAAFCAELPLERIGVLVNLSRCDRQAEYQRLSGLCDYAYRTFGAVITVAAGFCGEAPEQIAGQYVRCVRALEQRLIRYPGGVVIAGDEPPEKGVYYYPAEMELRLMESVKSGNLKSINTILDTIILENFVHSSLAPEASTCLLFNLMGAAIKVLNTLGYSANEIFGGEDLYKKITSCSNLQDMEATLRGMFYAICVYINSHKREGQMIDRITSHILLNSADPNLSLNAVASAFGLNPNYLSGYFKEQQGENFLVFLNRVRLEKAEELLRDTALGLEDIAHRTGYSGGSVLIRNFKKYCGMTPGQYREKQRKG